MLEILDKAAKAEKEWQKAYNMRYTGQSKAYNRYLSSGKSDATQSILCYFYRIFRAQSNSQIFKMITKASDLYGSRLYTASNRGNRVILLVKKLA